MPQASRQREGWQCAEEGEHPFGTGEPPLAPRSPCAARHREAASPDPGGCCSRGCACTFEVGGCRPGPRRRKLGHKEVKQLTRGTRVESGRVGLPRALNAELIIIIYSWSRVPQASGPPVHGKRLRHIASLTHGAPYRSINFPPQEGRSRFPFGARNLLVSYRWKTHTGGTGPSAI